MTTHDEIYLRMLILLTLPIAVAALVLVAAVVAAAAAAVAERRRRQRSVAGAAPSSRESRRCLPPPCRHCRRRYSTARQLRYKLTPCLPLCGQSPLPAAYATVQLPSHRESWRLCRHRHPADYAHYSRIFQILSTNYCISAYIILFIYSAKSYFLRQGANISSCWM